MPAPESNDDADPRALATIVLATHARSEFLRECVSDIVAAMRRGDELVVVECCNPDAATQLEGFAVPITHLTREHEAKCTKLNAALRRAGHEIVLLTDDDCRVPRDWVDEMTAPFANPAVGVVFGPVRGLSELPGTRSTASVAAGPAPPELWNFGHGASMAVRRSAVLDIGGFDERLGAGTGCRGGEEADVVLRAATRGWLCEIAGGATVHHLEWRDGTENHNNLLGYQRGSGAYLGAALRRDPRAASKTLALRLLHERGVWRDERHARGAWFGPRMTAAFAGGLLAGLRMRPRRDHAEVPEAERRARRRSDRLRVLWVTDEPPDRHGGGGNIRQAAMLHVLTDHADVTLLLAGTLTDDDVGARLHSVVEVPRPRRHDDGGPLLRRFRDLTRVLVQRQPAEVVESRRVHRALRPVLQRMEPDFDVVIVEHFGLAPLLGCRRSARWLLEAHNVPSERARQEAAKQQGARQRWLLAREEANALRFQRRVIPRFDRVIVVSESDASAVTGGVPTTAAPFVIVPNGVHLDRPPEALPDEPNILLPATLDYRPNVLGALWFCDEVFPLVRAAVPHARFALAGRHPVPEILALAAEPGVEVHDRVPRMRPWLDWARVIVVPLHVGTGTRLKALDAMEAGRPLVGTAIGLEGLGLVDGMHARIVDDAQEMAAAIVELLRSREQAETLAAQARRHAEASLRWDRVARALVEYLVGVPVEPPAELDLREQGAHSAVS